MIRKKLNEYENDLKTKAPRAEDKRQGEGYEAFGAFLRWLSYDGGNTTTLPPSPSSSSAASNRTPPSDSRMIRLLLHCPSRGVSSRPSINVDSGPVLVRDGMAIGIGAGAGASEIVDASVSGVSTRALSKVVSSEEVAVLLGTTSPRCCERAPSEISSGVVPVVPTPRAS